MMHGLVEDLKKLPQGYAMLERILAGGPYDDSRYSTSVGNRAVPQHAPPDCLSDAMMPGIPPPTHDTVRSKSKKRTGAALKRPAPGDAAAAAAAAGGGPTPETGCPHGEVYCKNLCRSCYQRWRRATVRVGVKEFEQAKAG